MPDEDEQFQEALELIRRAPQDRLQAHQAQTLPGLRRLPRSTTDVGPSQKSAMEQLIHAFEWNQCCITDFIVESHQGDYTIDVGHEVDSSSLDAKFRKVLSRRSLASEYLQWESKTHASSRLSELCQDLTMASERRNGHIRQYLDLKRDCFTAGRERYIRSMIEDGIKLLVFERLLDLSAISAILALKMKLFLKVKYTDFITLKRMISGLEWAMELVRGKAS